MGISNGLEIGSMDSETMPVCNKGRMKADAGQKDSDVKTASEIIDELKANHTINPVSPIPLEVGRSNSYLCKCFGFRHSTSLHFF